MFERLYEEERYMVSQNLPHHPRTEHTRDKHIIYNFMGKYMWLRQNMRNIQEIGYKLGSKSKY